MITTIQTIPPESPLHTTNTPPLHMMVIHIAILHKINPPHVDHLTVEMMTLRIQCSITLIALGHHIILTRNLDQFLANLHLLINLILTMKTKQT